MKRLLLLCLFTVCGAGQLPAQQSVQLDTIFLINRYNDFFAKHPSIRSIETGYDTSPFCEYLILTDQSGANHRYDLKFEGDKYYFDKQYPRIASPAAFLPIPRRSNCDFAYASYKIRPDTVYARIFYSCPTDTDDIVFTKVEARIGYPKGLQNISLALTPRLKEIQLKDSAFLLTAALQKDSTLSDLEVKKGNDAEAAMRIIQVLKNSKPWIPYVAGGRPVKSYIRIFVRIDLNRVARVFVEGIAE